MVADADDPASMTAMTARAKVICTTVGPYTHYGEPLVAACVETGTDYVDLSGEVLFMADMINKYEEKAKASGARIVHSCGFDSIPFDIGVAFVQDLAQKAWGEPAPRVKGRVRSMQGTFSGGTAASGRATLEAVQKDHSLFGTLVSPFGLTPGFEGPEQPTGNEVHEDEAVGSWVTPFVMAVINVKNVHRSNFLLGHPYGTDFAYDEMMMTGPGEEGKAMAEALAATDMMGDSDIKPGEGPSKEERENGFYDILLVAEGPKGTIKVAVKGDKDPGYGSTSKIIAETAMFLADGKCDKPGGVYTPAAAFGLDIVEPLVSRAGMTFKAED